MSPSFHLAAINFFTGDIQGGLGPFLAAWLAQTGHWSPEHVGLVTTAVGFGGMFLNSPAGLVADHTRHPKLLLAASCAVILVGTVLVVPAHSTWAVIGSQLLTAVGGCVLLPALTLLTLGIVGKDGFPGQQARNQAFNHAGIVTAAVLIYLLAAWVGPVAPFAVLGGMALLAIGATATVPGRSFNGRRAHGWGEDEPDEHEPRCTVRDLLRNRRLVLFAVALALFNLSNGTTLSLVAQRLVADGFGVNSWTAAYVVTAQVTMIPVALWAGSLADRRGRKHLLLIACLAQPVRVLLCSWVTDPVWLIPTEVLDGVASGLLGVATPVMVADLTWGTGRTQTALGGLNTLQGAGGALSGVLGGFLAGWLGWGPAFVALAVPALGAAGMAWRLEDTRLVAGASRAAGLPAG